MATAQLRARPAAASLSSLNIDATRMQFELEALLHPEVRNEVAAPKRDEESFGEIERKLQDFVRVLDQMGHLLEAERDQQQRAIMGKRVHTYRQRLSEFNGVLESKKQRYDRLSYQQQQRDQLFGNRSNDADGVLNLIGDYHQERDSLNNSHNIADQTINVAYSVLDNLQQQRSKLMGAHSKLQNIAQVLGLSDSLLNVIDRREKGDALLVYGGMAATCIFLFIVWRLTAAS
ncbi:Golgi SNAP receptor complex member 2 [Hondaea fermentalgiana]|uniref:Golgi SNAP receptor complex member 2 n=1 Tax=Hondaea fermentalgiana TaxID=2315210 RepID=A0A2R5GMT3_9STRA|nr:Golgi SNAP receptor complex member 2 [Hondaea fermentalgiana]|eukprot:GBG29621.1 Golgi SNAP receptor complex member 2 [Hondaea fermentalgiana]